MKTDPEIQNQAHIKEVQEKITMLEGVLSSRVIYGVPGTGYAKNLEGDYFV